MLEIVFISRDWKTGQDGTKYTVVFEENLFQSVRDLRVGQRFTFEQDNGPKHTAKATMV